MKMAPKKIIAVISPRVILNRVQKPMKRSPKIVNVKIESPVALAQLQAQTSRILSPRKAKTAAKQTHSPDTAKKPVRKCTTVIKTTGKHSEADSVTPQDQLHTPVTKKCIKNTAEKHSESDSVTPQEQLHSHVTRKSVKKTAEKHSLDDSVTSQENLQSPVTKNSIKKTAEKHSVNDSVISQEQLQKPCTRKYVKKTAKKHSVDDSVTSQEQLHNSDTRKLVKKTAEKHSVDDSVTSQEQLHTPVTRKYVKKTADKHSVDVSVTPQEQLHTPVTRKYVKKTAEKNSVDDSVTLQKQLQSPVTKKFIKKTAEKHSVDDLVTSPEQLQSHDTREHLKMTAEKHSVDDSVTSQEHLQSPDTRNYVKKTAEKYSVDDLVTPQEQLQSSVTREYVKTTAEKHSVDDLVTLQKQIKRRPGPKSRTLLEVSLKPAYSSVDDSVTSQEQLHTPVTRKYVKKTAEKHSVDDSVTSQEQLHTPVTRKYVKKTADKHSVDVSVTSQEQLHTPVTRKYVKKTAEKNSVDDSVTLQKQLQSPVTKKFIKKTAEKHSVDDLVTSPEQLQSHDTREYLKMTAEKYSVDDSVTSQEHLQSPDTRKYVKKTADKYSVDDSVTAQEQLHTLVTRKNVKKIAVKHSVDDSMTSQEQLHNSDTRKLVKKTAEKHSVDDSVTSQEQLHTPVTRKYVKKTAVKRSVDDTVTSQEQLHTPVTKKYVKKTAVKRSVDDTVSSQEQLHTPVTKKRAKKTAEKNSVDDSVTSQEQLQSPETRKYVKKTAEKHSVDNSVTSQEQLTTPDTRKYVKKTAVKRSVDDTVTSQEQLHTPVTKKRAKKTAEKNSVVDSVTSQKQLQSSDTRKYVKKTAVKHSVDDSVTSQEQLHTPVTRKYVKKTAEKNSVDDSVTLQKQLQSPVTKKFIKKTAEKHSVDDLVTSPEQLQSHDTREHLKMTAEKHSVDDSVTSQEHLQSPDTRNYVKKTAEKYSVDDLVTPQEQLQSSVTREYVKTTAEKHSVDDLVTLQKQIKRRPGPKSRTLLEISLKPAYSSVDDSVTLQKQIKKRPGPKTRTFLEVKKKPAYSVTKAMKQRIWEKQKKSVKPAEPEIGLNNTSDILNKEGFAAVKGCEKIAATPIKKPNGSMLKNISKIPSPPQPTNCPNSVTSNKSISTWTKDISTESSIPSDSGAVTSNDCVRLNSKLEHSGNPEQLEVQNDNSKLSSISSYDSESSLFSSSLPKLGGKDIPEPNLSTSSITPTSPISDEMALYETCEEACQLIAHFKEKMGIECPLKEYILNALNSGYGKGLNLIYDASIEACQNFDRDLEALMQNHNFEKSVEHHRTADFMEQTDNRSLEDSRQSRYEDNLPETSTERSRHESVQNDSEVKLGRSCQIRRVSAANAREAFTNLPDNQLVPNINREDGSPTDSFRTFTSDRTHDDDDALSLDAESINGMETLRLDPVASVSNVSQDDVYVPEYSPMTRMQEKYIYEPTKIQVHESKLDEESIEDGEIISTASDDDSDRDTTPKEISPACVPSSGSKDMNIPAKSDRISSIAEESGKRTESQISVHPLRLFSSYQAQKPCKSPLYKGMCFFHLAYTCKKIICNFPHRTTIDLKHFKNTLQSLTEDNLIEEYLLMCKCDKLRITCIFFVEECKRRAATRILFEMAIDLGLGIVQIAEALRVEVLETTLLHLNTISLDACGDLLQFENNGRMMCDALLACMANSQNFAQFKPAFGKLAELLFELKRPVDIHVASCILERVCILPMEDQLARGMLTLMKNTEVGIFESSLAQKFAVQLSVTDGDVYELYLLAKEAALGSPLAQPDEKYPTPLLNLRGAQIKPPYLLRTPDFTNMGNPHEYFRASKGFVEARPPQWNRGRYGFRGGSRRGRRNPRNPDWPYQWWYVLHRN